MWRCVTSCHDWRDGSFLEHLLTVAADVGAIDEVTTWVQLGYSGRRRKVTIGADALSARLRELVGDVDGCDIEAGGKAPADWSLTVHVGDWRTDAARVDGMSMIQIDFSGAKFAHGEGSQQLRDAFRRAHGPETTEYAAIHPWEPWVHLRAGPYQPAVTTGVAFAGVAWANFLGRGHIEDFDRARLDVQDGFTFEWRGEDGLFAFATADLDEARSSGDVEEQLVSLTKMFRHARTWGSQ
jgi:hypothetical protein